MALNTQKKNKSYFAVTVTEKGKHYSYVLPVGHSSNILSVFAGIVNLSFVLICNTKKEAAATIKAWNEAYKTNGTYLFDEPLF